MCHGREAARKAADSPTPPISSSSETINREMSIEDRTFFSEQLFPLVQDFFGEECDVNLVGKIIGMLLELEYEQISALLNDEKELHKKIQEAKNLLST